MNILHLLNSLEIGGAEKITIETAIAMQLRGHNVFVDAPSGPLEYNLLQNDIKFSVFKMNISRKNLLSYYYLYFLILRNIRENKIDVIHIMHR